MDNPEINLARRLVERKILTPPIDIFKLTKNYATIEINNIPFEIDGISLDLKVPGKKPHIILNNIVSSTRMRFTLAHELGHILIPWHMGIIIDITRESSKGFFLESQEVDNHYYWMIEAEANRFASELLIPSSWVKVLIKRYKTPEIVTRNIMSQANVSPQAATISLIKNFPPGYVCVLVDDKYEVIFSGKSNGTLASTPEWNTIIDPEKCFSFCKNIYQFEINGKIFIWWSFNDDVDIPQKIDNREWRDILDGIIDDIKMPENQKISFKRSLNGVIAAVNSRVRGRDRTLRSLYSACLQRLFPRKEYSSLVKHSDFKIFLWKRSYDLINKK